MKADIVIGLGYGDEGKGRVVDQLCSERANPIVVRFSGGQQCGHTVMTKLGKHIHASYPSGTLSGYDGYISEHCTVSPKHLVNEWMVLSRLTPKHPKLYIHPLAKVTLPWDILTNRETEKVNQHGSCGMGVGATMKRHIETPYKFHVIDLLNDEIMWGKLNMFEQQFGILNDDVFLQFKKAVTTFRNIVEVADYSVLENRNLIFEGSQGILLDKDHGVFPHVTYANTTSKNAIEILSRLSDCKPMLHYVTRSYSTRHGNGPFDGSVEELKLVNTEEEINVTNEWQGEFKTRPLDLGLLNHAIRIDQSYNGNTLGTLHVTCCDQLQFQFDISQFDGVFKIRQYTQPNKSEYL